MTPEAIAAVAFMLGVASCYLVHRAEIRYLRSELKGTHAQIAHAVMREGAEVPALFEDMPEIEPLSKKLREIVNEWEDADSRAVQEAKIRGWIAEGWGEKAIIRQFQAGEPL